MATDLEKIIPGDGAQTAADKIYNNDTKTLAAAEAKTDLNAYYNVSQINNKFDYADSATARNIVPTAKRAVGQALAYKTVSGWVFEQYIGTSVSGWATASNWKRLDGLQPEDIHQKVDDTTDKPISPAGVKNGLLDIEGIGYRETTTPPSFTNIITSYNYKTGFYLNNNAEVTSSGHSYNQDYTPVKPSTKYLHSNPLSIAVLFYTANKTFISQTGGALGGSFTTPANCEFVRYNIDNSFDFGGGVYMYEAATTSVVSDKLGVLIGVGDIVGAQKTDVSINSGSILPSSVTFANNALDPKGKATIGGWKHSEDYIPISANTSYETNLSNAQPFMWFYDNAKRLISYIGTSDSGLPFGAFTTPVNAAYFRFNSKTTNMSPFYVRRTAGASEAYYIPNLVVPKSNVVDLDASGGEVVQTIPYSEDGNKNTTTAYFSYVNQEPTRGKYIQSVELNIANANSSVWIAFAADAAGSSILWRKQFTGLPAGKNTLEVGREQGTGEFLCFSGVYKYTESRPNPVGGGIAGGVSLPNADLCVGVNTIDTGGSGSGDKKFNYISLGDSITYGAGATTPYSKLMSFKLGGSFNNYAVSGAKCYGASGNVLITQVAKVPDNFVGVLTIMIGINDVSGNSPLGDVPTVLSKNFADLNAGASFAEAFRLCLETILRKAPNAVVIVIPPLKAWTGQETKIDGYRQVERDICEYFAVPYTDTYKRCLVAPLTYPRLMPDALHPNDDGHLEVMRVLWGDVESLISYLKG